MEDDASRERGGDGGGGDGHFWEFGHKHARERKMDKGKFRGRER
jgi:hypothetical protein